LGSRRYASRSSLPIKLAHRVSYDVYVKKDVDSLGRDEFGEAVGHFVEQGNAVALKRRLVARGETVLIERSLVHGLSEVEKERRFSDYSRVPEYELSREPSREPSESPESPGPSDAPADAGGEAQEHSERPKERSWRRRMFGG
jgi:hypothetical protein